MNSTTTSEKAKSITALSAKDWKNHYLGHRALTKRVLEAFPEKEFFSFSIGGMRTAAELTAELLAIGYPGMAEVVTGKGEELKEEISFGDSKELAIQQWENSSEKIAELWDKISEERFDEHIVAFGQYPGKVWSIISYYIDNEIHHRAQMYVYLRALGIEPPAFYDRSPFE